MLLQQDSQIDRKINIQIITCLDHKMIRQLETMMLRQFNSKIVRQPDIQILRQLDGSKSEGQVTQQNRLHSQMVFLFDVYIVRCYIIDSQIVCYLNSQIVIQIGSKVVRYSDCLVVRQSDCQIVEYVDSCFLVGQLVR